MSWGILALIILGLLFISILPNWSHSRSWGYGPSGGVGLVLITVVTLFLLGRL